MNEQSERSEIGNRGSDSLAGRLDAQLSELLEVVWACEVAARREDRIDAAVKYGRL